MCPFFRPTKTAKHFSPLSCVLVQPHMSPDVGDTPETSLPRFLHLSVFTNFFFRSSSSICFPLPVPFSKGAKKAQTTTFLIKFLGCFFPSTTYFFLLAFLGLKAVFLFDVFIFSILQGWGKANSGSGRWNRGGRFVSFFLCFFWSSSSGGGASVHCKKPFSLGHVTPHCWSHWWIFMGVIFSSKLWQWLVAFLAAQAVLNFDL